MTNIRKFVCLIAFSAFLIIFPVASLAQDGFGAPSFNGTIALPQLVVGGGWDTLIRLVNVSQKAEEIAITWIPSKGKDGASTPMLVYREINGSDSIPNVGAVSFPMFPSGASKIVRLFDDPNTPVRTGTVFVLFNRTQKGDCPFIVQMSFRRTDDHGVVTGETTVLPAASGTSFIVPFLVSSATNTGVAISNVSYNASIATPVTVDVALFNQWGVQVGSAIKIDLEKFAEVSKFVDELFPGATDIGMGFMVVSVSEPGAEVQVLSLQLTTSGVVSVVATARTKFPQQ